MAEIALVSARKTRLELQANKGDQQAKHALSLAVNPDTFLSTVQIGITLMSILTGIFSGENIKGTILAFISTTFKNSPYILKYSNSIATVIVVLCITYLSLVSELVAKRIGLSMPERIAKMVAAPMSFLSKVTYPFIWLLSKSTNFISNIFKITPNDSPVTEEEIKAMISEGTNSGTIEEKEQEIIERVFHLGDRNITSLMTHRTDIVWMDVHCKVVDIKQKMREVVHTNYPMCEGAVDNIKGIVSIKDILLAHDDLALAELMKPAIFVPENNSVYHVLE
jgi:putative hemolysin